MVRERSRLVDEDDFRLQVWLKDWAKKGGDLPSHLPLRLFRYLEEEICLAFETMGNEWSGARQWRKYRVIGDEPTKVRPTEEFLDGLGDPVFTWCAPPRMVDRIVI